jgi:chromate reductase
MTPLKLLAIVGSLRSGSVNAATARAAAAASPDGVSITVHDVSDVPLYNGDDEDAGPPASVLELHAAVESHDGVLLFTPEYNSSFPAVTKNVIDWLSRPPKSWDGVPFTLVATSPGARAGLGVRDHFSAIMTRQPVRLFETHGIGSYGDKLDNGELIDAETVTELAEFVSRFAAFCVSDVVD